MANNSNRISDELLASFLDGNTTADETRQVLEAMRTDAQLRETINVALQVHREPVTDILPMRQIAAESGENLCGVMCEAYILGHRGIAYQSDDLVATALEKRWLRASGSPLHAMGQLLAHHGLMVTHRYDATVDDIADALVHDNDVIVAVAGNELYDAKSEKDGTANHAVVVTAISDECKEVTIYDPDQNELQKVDITNFKRAWQASLNYMVRVLQEAGEYDPQPINLDDIELTDDLMELREAIAENAHDVWAVARMKDGWTFGLERDDTLKHHPDLIPYSALSDSEKEYDRLMALNTIKLVKKLGFDIVKR